MRPGKLTLAAFDWRRPRGPISYAANHGGTGEERLEKFVYAPGTSLVDLENADGSTPAADDQSHARHDEGAGYAVAGARLAGLRGPRRVVTFTTNRVDLEVGMTLGFIGA